MTLPPLPRLLAALIGAWFVTAVQAAPCTGAPDVREATPAQVAEWFAAQPRREVIGFYGYSGSQYQDPAKMLAVAERTLRAADPKKALVLIGATADGIGAVYEVAKRLGFGTVGIVSSRARTESARLSDCVDTVFVIADTVWGGHLPGTTTLSPTSTAMVASSTRLVAIGGNETVRDELLAARAARKPIRFHAADHHHGLARDRAYRAGTETPKDFKGAAHAVFAAKR